jgi:integrase
MRQTGLNRLSERKIRAAAAAVGSPVALADGGGLYLRAGGGRAAWRFQYVHDGRRRAMGLGAYPDVGLARARAVATEARALLAGGGDPLDAREQAQREREERRRAARAVATVAEVAESFYARTIARRHRKPEFTRKILDDELLPHLGALRVDAVTRRDVAAALARILDRGAPRRANQALAVAKQLFDYAVDHGHREDSPAAGIKRRNVGGREATRERNLSFEELAQVVRVLWSDEFFAAPTTRAVLQLLVLTGQRVGETVRARWEHVDVERGVWSIPAEHTKAGRAHVVHLSPPALDVLRAIRPAGVLVGYVFAGPSRTREPQTEAPHATERAINRALCRLLDGAQADMPAAHHKAKPNELKTQRKKPRANLQGMAHFTPHDLRRTMVSRLADMGVSPHVVEKMVNHALQGVMAVYNRSEYMEQRAEAFAMWGAKIAALRGDNVVSLPRLSA